MWRSIAQLGAERARGCYQAYAEAVETVERLIREETIDCDYLASGKLKLASKPHHLEHLEKTAELIRREVDPDVEVIGRERIRSEVESDSFFGGLLHKHGGQMHMGKFAVGLANAAARNGVRLFENAAVTSIEREGGAYRIVSARGEVRAKQVLIATGPSRHGPFGWYRRRMAPVGSFIVVTEPLPAAELARRVAAAPLVHDEPPDAQLLSRDAGFAAPVRRPRALHGIGTAFRCQERPHPAGEPRRDVPDVGDARIDYCWGGLVDITVDRLPHAGQHDGIYFSMGYSGHGTQMATHMGQVMAEVIGGNAISQSLARVRLARHSGPHRQALVPAARGHVLPDQRYFLLIVHAPGGDKCDNIKMPDHANRRRQPT